jgi:sigma-B regulation protein RsbU (phosphoserine phosphatase)
VQFSFGGHNPPYIKRKEGAIERINNESGFLLGMLDEMEYDVHKITLRPGDTILLYTDGVTEAMNGNAELFEESRLEASLRRLNGSPLKEMLDGINADLMEFAAGAPQADDITMLALQYRGKTSAPA